MIYRSNCVVDTNILIDLRNGGLITEFFKLPVSVHAPDVIVAEMLDSNGEIFLAHGMEVRELSGKQVREVYRLRLLQPNVSTNDMFALVLARDTRATLLTGDKNLRKFAEQQMVTVHGMLWVLDELVRLNVISRFAVAEALERLIATGSRLPREACEARLLRWRSLMISSEGVRARL